jgi:L-iditol 2-dehydrogenase
MTIMYNTFRGDYILKVARLYTFDNIRVEDMPVPAVGSGEALMKTKASGICSGDVMRWYIEKKAPLVPGHEPSGEIVEVGEGVRNFKPGDRVFVHHHAPCLECSFCRRGAHVHCRTWKETGILPGGISEYILIPKLNLEHDTLELPHHVTFEDGIFVEPVACVVKALKRAHIRRGDTVLVIGLGVMGQLHALLSRKYGAGKVIGADMVPYRLRKARECGVDQVVDVSTDDLISSLNDLTHGTGADVVIVGPNSVDAMKQGIASAAPGGRVVFFTPAKPGERLTITPNDLYFRDVSIVNSYSCGPSDTADALDIIGEGTVSAEKLVTHRFSIGETAEAFRLTAEARDSLKSIIVFE